MRSPEAMAFAHVLDTPLPFGCGTRGEFFPEAGWETARSAEPAPEADALSGAPVVVAAVHGILTTTVRPTWPWRLQAWCSEHAPEMHVLAEHYFLGPWPRLNYWRNIALGRALARRLALYLEAGREVHMVGHSNGGCICLVAARELARMGAGCGKIVLIGAAVESDVERSGVLRLVREGWVESVECWHDPADPVLGVPGILRWPYGDAGRRGLTLGGRPADSARLRNVRHHGMGHTGYFAPEREEQTWRRLRTAIED